MVAKLIVWDVDREHATRRMLRALGEYEIGGLTTLIPFHKALLATDQWANGETCRDLMEDREWLKTTAPESVDAPAETEDGAELVTRDYKVEVSGKLFDVKVIGEAAAGAAPAAGGKKPPKRERKAGGAGGARDAGTAREATHRALAGLADLGLFPHALIEPLRAIVRCGFTVLVSGPPGAGKTTLLTELLGEVSPLERIITVEKNLLELRLEDDPRHPDAPALFTRRSNAEGEGEITTRQLVELTRRLNPDRVVVGELVEDEALDMLDVASMCKRGSLATIHAHTADIVLSRLAYYVSKSNTNLPEFAVWSLIAQTVDFVVHIDLVRNAAEDQSPVRRVTSIVEVGGPGEAGGVASTEVWGLDRAGRLVQVAPLSPRHVARLRLAGYDTTLFAADAAGAELGAPARAAT